MNLILKIKLLTTPEQANLLLEAMEAFNAACNAASNIAFELKTASKYRIQKACYYDLRKQFDLPAQMAVRAIGKVAEAYRRDKKKHHRFKTHGAMVLDNRLLSYKGMDRVSIATLQGRQVMPFICGGYGEQKLRRIKGQADLVYRDGKFFLLQNCVFPDHEPFDPKGFLGVDLGIANLAVDSNGEVFSGGQVNGLRHRYARLRARLQAKGTESAKRVLKKRSAKEKRFARDINHQISKKLVAKAQGTGQGIALEDLKGIRDRITVRKAQRRTQHSWSFSQLRSFIEYKAQMAGVPVIAVDPRNTSRTCPFCGHIDKRNRLNQNTFSCKSCGYSGLADYIAARNIASRAAVNLPYAGRSPLQATSAAPASYRLLAGSS